jgi:sarcosine oxidase
MTSYFNTIVVGLGAMGSAATYQLALRGSKVLGIDQYSPPHSMGSSHGDTRITRQAIGEGDQFTPLSLRSYEIFQEIERLTGKNLLRITGGLMISGEVSKGVHGVADFFTNMLEAARKFAIEHEVLDAAEIRRRFPQFNVSNKDLAYYEHRAGFLYAEECVRTQLMLAESNGAEVHRNEKVRSIKQNGNFAVVITDQREYRAETVVASAGPWICDFIDHEIQRLFTIERQVQYWFDVESSYRQFSPEKFPVFIWQTAKGHSYGFPAVDGPTGGFKIGCSLFNAVVTPSTIDRTVGTDETAAMFNQQVKDFFPGASEKCVRTSVCLYTSTPDAGFVIDTLPGFSSVLICSACSGHGFKHSAAIGECIAELITQSQTKIDINNFELGRLLGTFSEHR